MRIKKIPQRMCVGCKEMKNKKSLIRVVKTPENLILIDITGKKQDEGHMFAQKKNVYNWQLNQRD